MSGIALCQGNFTLMTDDLPGVIRIWQTTENLLCALPRCTGTGHRFCRDLPR